MFVLCANLARLFIENKSIAILVPLQGDESERKVKSSKDKVKGKFTID